MHNPITLPTPLKNWRLLWLLCAMCFSEPAQAAQNKQAIPDKQDKQDQQATTGDAPLALRFRDFYQSPVGPAGLQISAALRAAHAQRVQLTGYMVAQEVPLDGHFFLTPRPMTMSAHADGEADDLPPSTVLVQMPEPDQALPVLATPGLLQLTGRLQVGRFEMLDGRVVWLRLLLEPRCALAPPC